MMQQIVINGQGIAAITTAWELAARGFSITLAGHRQGKTLRLVLEEHTIELLNQVYGMRLADCLHFQPLSSRVIRGWDSATSVVTTESLSVSLQSLTETLRSQLQARFANAVSWSESKPESNERTGFQIDASGRNEGGLSFGHRVATMASVETCDTLSSSVIERTDYGWAFLVPHGDQNATLFAFAAGSDCDATEVLKFTASDHFSAECVTLREHARPWQPCSPRLSRPLVTNSEILVGESAFTFDPICGDGVGYAARSAILAATVVADRFQAELRGLTYYAARLLRAFSAHLRGCASVYAGWANRGWGNELSATNRGLAFLSHQHISH